MKSPIMCEMTAPNPLVSIIVVNWNGIAFLDECLGSLERQTWTKWEVIIVDNGSTDGSTELLIAWAERRPNARTILLSHNTGFCYANNAAFAIARGEWIAPLNTDAVPEPQWLEELLRYADTS